MLPGGDAEPAEVEQKRADLADRTCSADPHQQNADAGWGVGDHVEPGQGGGRRDGVVDEDEVAMLKAVVYGAGGAGGADVDRMEADLLFEINDATEDNEGHHSSWGEFFVEAIGKHVLEDEVSPGVIDEDEGSWLLSKITAKGGDDFGPLELELLAHIKSNATSIHGPLKDKV